MSSPVFGKHNKTNHRLLTNGVCIFLLSITNSKVFTKDFNSHIDIFL